MLNECGLRMRPQTVRSHIRGRAQRRVATAYREHLPTVESNTRKKNTDDNHAKKNNRRNKEKGESKVRMDQVSIMQAKGT